MQTERWTSIKTLFLEILAMETGDQKARLEQIKADSPDLYEELSSLLQADATDSSILDGYAVDSIDLSELVPMEGLRVGPFEIRQQIGSGGMGNVYLAQRVEGGFEQQVALKLIKYGMGGGQAVNRFLVERSILARLQHPHIARLIDGGFTAEGRPWFAMEHVEGETISSWCRKRNLSLNERLKLFLEVTEAVQYAHKNLVVHHDLKPGNIMVTGDDDRPRIKLLDFGIAGILEETGAESGGNLALTRAYASPEQLAGESTSTATDIYSLGVVLHELITGCHPEPEFRSHDCIPRPMPAELAAVCTRAVHPDREHRYENASDMGDELMAWLENRPVRTFSKKPLYRLGKWMKRNRMASAITAVSMVTLISLILVYTGELKKETERSRNEALRATRIASVLGSSLRSIDPMENGGQQLTARGMVDRSTAYINNQLSDDPHTRSGLLIMMANIYANLIVPEVADSVSALAEQLMHSTGDTTTFAYIDMLADRSIILDKAGKYEEGLATMHRALDLANRYLDPNSLGFASVHLDYTYHLDANQEYYKADSVLRMVEPIYEQNPAAAGEAYDDFIFYMGTNYRRLGEFNKAREYLYRSLKLSRTRYSGAHEQIASTLNHISSLHQNMGDYEKALPYAQEAHRMRLEIFGRGHLNTLAAHSNTARTYSGAGRLEEAAETYRDVLAIFREEYGNDNFYIAGLLQSYAGVFLRMEEYRQAEEILTESLEHSRRLLPPGHIRQAYPLKSMADALRGQLRFAEAVAYAERALELRASLPPDHAELINTRYTLGLCLWHLDRRDEATPHLAEALAFYQARDEQYRTQIEKLQALGF